MTLYEYSQLGCAIVTLSGGVTLMLIGNTKVKSSSWLSWAKWAFAAVLIVVGLFNLAQYALDLNVSNPKISRAMSVSMLYAVTFILAIAFIPLANKMPMSNTRPKLTAFISLLCIAMAWATPWCETSLATILSVSSLALYLIELMRIIITFAISFKMMSGHHKGLNAEENSRYSYLYLVWRCVSLLLLFALLYVFLVLLSFKAMAIYNFASLILWIYVFVNFVNLIINYQSNQQNDTEEFEPKEIQITDNKTVNIDTHLLAGLGSKLDKWVASGSYCHKGITMTQVAEKLGTNRTYLSRYINSYYGCNFNAWLTRLRIDEAKRLLLASPTLSLEKVSLQLGFTSKSQFISAFKSQEGITPGQWRVQHG